jgi:hypothetical protein
LHLEAYQAGIDSYNRPPPIVIMPRAIVQRRRIEEMPHSSIAMRAIPCVYCSGLARRKDWKLSKHKQICKLYLNVGVQVDYRPFDKILAINKLTE